MQIVISVADRHLTDCGPDGNEMNSLSAAIIAGPRARYEVIATQDLEELVGIAFQPGGFAPLFRERADLLVEQSTPLDALAPRATIRDRLREAGTAEERLALLEAFLLERFRRMRGHSSLAAHAIALLRDRRISISECAQELGASTRRLSQVFREQVGLAPKVWCRIERFQTIVRALHTGADVPWSRLALECGYYDQSHFANDFRVFSGINPTTYSAKRGTWQNHVPVQ